MEKLKVFRKKVDLVYNTRMSAEMPETVQRSHPLEWSEVERAGGNEDGVVRMRFSAASDLPVYRYGFDEILVITSRNADYSFLNSGNAPLLLHHDARNIVGRVVSSKVEKRDGHNALVVEVEFRSDDPESAAALAKVKRNLLRNVSVSWQPSKDGYHIERGKESNEVEKLVFDGFSMREVSLVSVPADSAVGVGRSYINGGTEMANPNTEQTAAAPAAPPPAELSESAQEVPARAVERSAAAQQDAPKATAEQRLDPTGQRWLSKNEARLKRLGASDESIDKLREMVDAEAGCSAEAVKAASVDFLEAAEAPSREAPAIGGIASKVFDLARVAQQLARGKDLDGLEDEYIKDHNERNAHIMPDYNRASPHAAIIPHAALLFDPTVRRMILPSMSKQAQEEISRAYEVGSSPAGHFHGVFDEGYFIEALYPMAKLLGRVTRLPTELVQDLKGVNESGTFTVQFTTEKATRTESTGVSFGNHEFTWHLIAGLVETTQRTLDQSRFFWPRIQYLLQRDMARAINGTIINGASSSNQPVGVMNYASVDTTALGTNGGNLTYAKLVDLYTTIENNNVDPSNVILVMTSAAKGYVQKTSRFVGSTGNAADKILSDMDGAESGRGVDGYEVVCENNLPKNLTKGTGTGLHALLCGNFAEIEMATFSAMEMLVDPFTSASTSKIKIYLRQAFDHKPRHIDAFAIMKDVLIS